MCGRFTLTAPKESIVNQFALNTTPVLKPRYNIAPATAIPVILEPKTLTFAFWGLVPDWMQEWPEQNGWINARAETVTEKPAFRAAIRHGRCLVVADGFYEWKTIGQTKQPYYFSLPNHTPFAIAGIYTQRERADGKPSMTCSLLTVEANTEIKSYHTRMPLILSKTQYKTWLNKKANMTKEIIPILSAPQEIHLNIYPVSKRVNRATYDTRACIMPLTHT